MTATHGRTGRPPLTEERKAAVRLEIARAAVALFVEQGVAATTGEQIGQAVGVSARTVWRYFPSKESCVRPLLATGIDAIADALRCWPVDRPLEGALEHLWATEAVVVGPDIGALLRLTRTEPGLRAVWLRTHDEAEPVFARALAERAGLPADDLRPAVQAAMLNAALRVAVEHHAWHTAGADGGGRAALEDALRTALGVAAAGLA